MNDGAEATRPDEQKTGTAPEQEAPLTDEQIQEIFDSVSSDDPDVHLRFARALLAASPRPLTEPAPDLIREMDRMSLALSAHMDEADKHGHQVSGADFGAGYRAALAPLPLVSPSEPPPFGRIVFNPGHAPVVELRGPWPKGFADIEVYAEPPASLSPAPSITPEPSRWLKYARTSTGALYVELAIGPKDMQVPVHHEFVRLEPLYVHPAETRLARPAPDSPSEAAPSALQDAERLDWYAQNSWQVSFGKGYHVKPDAWFFRHGDSGWHECGSLREAIDAAMAATTGSPK